MRLIISSSETYAMPTLWCLQDFLGITSIGLKGILPYVQTDIY